MYLPTYLIFAFYFDLMAKFNNDVKMIFYSKGAFTEYIGI